MKIFLLQALKIAGLTLGLAGFIYLISLSESLSVFIHSSIWLILVCSALIGLIIAIYNANALSKSAQSFVPLFLGSMLIRLFLSLAVIAYLLFEYHDLRIVLVLNFFVIYLFYLVFEIYSIISNLRPISKQGEIND